MITSDIYSVDRTFVYRVKRDTVLLAMDVCKNIQQLKKIRSSRMTDDDYSLWVDSLDFAFDCAKGERGEGEGGEGEGEEMPVRFSGKESDRQMTDVLCKLGFDGYAADSLRAFKSLLSASLKRREDVSQDREFHPEVFLCKPRKHLRYVTSYPAIRREKRRELAAKSRSRGE